MKPETQHIVREELLRSIAWAGLAMVGWPILISEIAWLEATALTVVGLPVLSWAVLTGTFIGVRVVVNSPLRIETPAGFSIGLVLGIMFAGVGAIYLVTAQGYPALWVTAGYIGVTVGTILSYWYTGYPKLNGSIPAR